MTVKVFTVAQMVAAEKAADAAGHSYEQMMAQAGRGVAEAVLAREEVGGQKPAGQKIVVLVGPGNNGGDALVAGRHLAEAGAVVYFYLSRRRDAQQDENFARVEAMGLPVAEAGSDEGYALLRAWLQAADGLVDGLLGTGVNRPIAGQMAELMAVVQEVVEARRRESYAAPWVAAPWVAAVDCPSGLNCDTGELDALAVAADVSVTFAGPKRGHFLFPGAAAVGELVVVDIGIDEDLPEVQGVPVALATAAWARETLPERPLDGHKGTFGKVLLAAGSEGYWGAPVLCGRGAYRAGAGLVALAVPRVVRSAAAVQLPEATFPAAPDEANWSEAGARFVLDAAGDYDALLVGPGMGEGAQVFMETLLGAGERLPPLVVDADGLNGLAKMDGGMARLPHGAVLTPHPGEMARLVGEEAGRERIALAQAWAEKWGQVVVLKGAHTVVAAADGRCMVMPFANPLLGSAGSGDVLAGVVVALRGQGLAAFEAAALGAYLHGLGGELAREEMGDAGLLSSELADWVMRARRVVA